MDELTIDGKTYVSSKRAAAITGYAKDYVGQLCREGRVEARLVGRSWYVYEPSIRAHRFEEQGSEAPVPVSQEEAIVPVEAAKNEIKEEVNPSEKANVQAVWQTPTYHPEESAELPLAVEEAEDQTAKTTPQIEENTVEEIENAWQSWFKGEKSQEPQVTIADEPEETVEQRQEEEKEVSLHVIRAQEERRVEYVDMPRQQEKIVTEPVYVSTPRQQRSIESNKPQNVKNYLAIRAVLIAVIIIATALALLGSGFIKVIPQDVVRDFYIIQYFEGISSVNKTVE